MLSADAFKLDWSQILSFGKRVNGVSTLFQIFNYIAEICALIHTFLGFFFTSTLHNILSKPLAAFPHNYSQNNDQHREE